MASSSSAVLKMAVLFVVVLGQLLVATPSAVAICVPGNCPICVPGACSFCVPGLDKCVICVQFCFCDCNLDTSVCSGVCYHNCMLKPPPLPLN